jgi:pteridine reductase
MRVAVHYHGAEAGAAESCRLVREAGGEAHPFQGDLTTPDAPAALVDAVAAHFGGLDVLVNSAAVMVRTPVGEVTPDQWDAMFALNLRAPFFAAQAAARAMGVVQMTRALARALAPRVRVNAIAPGVVLLPDGWDAGASERLRGTTPLARHGTPEDVAQAMLYLLDAEFVTGETILVDGGRHVRR